MLYIVYCMLYAMAGNRKEAAGRALSFLLVYVCVVAGMQILFAKIMIHNIL
jgi:hypothetical protein